MSIKSIIVPVRGDGKGDSVLGLALAIGRAFNSHIDVLHVHGRPEDLIPYGAGVAGHFRDTIVEAAGNLARQEEEKLRALFEEYCATHKAETVEVGASDIPSDRLTMSWREEEGKQPAVIERTGRLTDLIVVARPDKGGEFGMNSLLSALFDVRKLTAVAPPQIVPQAGRHVAIAWNGGPEAGRAVSGAMPILQKAEKVTIFTAPDENSPARTGDKLRRYLRLHDVASEIQEFKAGWRNIGGPLLEAAHGAGCDMLVMGAFGSEKRREFILGGVTEYVIEHSDLPLIMTH